MNIKPIIYEQLTPAQRIIASIEAMARGDEKEEERLIKTCPKKLYNISDPVYAYRLEALQDMAMAVECDMRGHALDYLEQLLSSRAPDQPKGQKYLLPDTSSIQEMLSIKKAWHDLLRHEGIDPATMDKAHNYLGHYLVQYFMELGARLELKTDSQTVEEYKDVLSEYLRRVVN